MKIFEKIKSRKLSKTLAVMAASGILFFGAGNVSAAPDDDVAFEFKEAYLAAPQDNRVFRQNILLFGTTFHLEVNGDGQALRDGSMRMSGNINWEYTNPSTSATTSNLMPFYMVQEKEEMTLYVQRNNKWSKLALPAVPLAFVTALKSTDINVLQQNLNAVKNVTLFRDNGYQQIFNVTLDGKYISEFMKTHAKTQNTAELSDEEVAAQARFARNLDNALQNTDVVCTWTVDKTTHKTVTAVIDFTDLMRAYAKSVLDESAAGTIVLDDEDRMLMETIGYYSEFHYTLNYKDPKEKLNFKLPSAAKKAKVNNNIFEDFLDDMSTSVKRK